MISSRFGLFASARMSDFAVVTGIDPPLLGDRLSRRTRARAHGFPGARRKPGSALLTGALVHLHVIHDELLRKRRRLLADVLHDVELTACGPAVGGNAVAEHPEGRPEALAARELRPCFEFAVGLREGPECLEPRRGIGTLRAVLPAVGFPARGD